MKLLTRFRAVTCPRNSEHIGAQVVARHRALSGLLNLDATLGRNASRLPVVDVLWQDVELAREFRRAPYFFDGLLKG